ncbi:hypothetical protein FCJ57_13990 [Burkholderia diffusa]|nr:hypothetical protein [Burkholderia diffusa]
MIDEAFFVLAEGIASAEGIDQGMMLGASRPIGPLALADLAGLDVCLAVMDVFVKDSGTACHTWSAPGGAWAAMAATNPAVVGAVSVRAAALLVAGQDPGRRIVVKHAGGCVATSGAGPEHGEDRIRAQGGHE